MNKPKIEYSDKRLIFILSMTAAALVTCLASYVTGQDQRQRLQKELSEKIFRVHVIANSDSREDQELKLKVRDSVMDYFKEELPKEAGAEKIKEWARAHSDKLEEISEAVIKVQGADYPVQAAVATCYFPDKTYGNILFPAGNYEALRIEIGKAKGRNWWCILYPKLWLEKASNLVIPEEETQPEEVLAEEDENIFHTSKFKIKWYYKTRRKK